jgi:hypothetical protein
LTSVSNLTFLLTVRHGSKAGDWGTHPKRFAARAAAGVPCSMITSPDDAASRPAMMRSSVVLPLPDGPSRETNSPR